MTPITQFFMIFALLFSAQSYACDSYQIRNILQNGGYAEIDNSCSSYDARQLAEIGQYRLTVSLDGYSGYDARQIVEAGASFSVSNTFSSYDVRQICESLVSPAVGEVYSDGFSDYDLRQFSDAGCRIIDN